LFLFCPTRTESEIESEIRETERSREGEIKRSGERERQRSRESERERERERDGSREESGEKNRRRSHRPEAQISGGFYGSSLVSPENPREARSSGESSVVGPQ
jgi:hypothetical protein